MGFLCFPSGVALNITIRRKKKSDLSKTDRFYLFSGITRETQSR